MNRGRTRLRAWLLFGCALLLAVSALATVSVIVWRKDGEQAAAHVAAVREENARLALWALDSLLSGELAREQARPWFEYLPQIPRGRPYHQMLEPLGPGDTALESPLAHPPAGVRAYFMWQGGALSSLQAGAASSGPLLAEVADVLRAGLDLPGAPDVPPAPVVASVAVAPPAQRLNEARQMAMNDSAFQARNRNYVTSLQQAGESLGTVSRLETDAPLAQVSVGSLSPLWIGDQLALAREVRVGEQRVVQGLVLDRSALEERLRAEVADLVPAAHFERATADTPGGRRLAALPLAMVVGELAVVPPASRVPLVLGLAWAVMLLAAAVATVMVRGILALSERRAAFVSAVTHELRTPLTTLSMYTEMLAAGMVTDGARRKEYHDTLHAETRRLGHLVENVLDYARLERGRRSGTQEPVSLNALLDRARATLQTRVDGAGATLDFAIEAGETEVLADVGAVGRILFNLVDNACKYAADAPHVTVAALARPRFGVLRVCDDGPGVPPELRARLFEPFEKSATRAAATASGVGLGLALSRGLARDMGGDLVWLAGEGGAVFELTLPLRTARARSTP